MEYKEIIYIYIYIFSIWISPFCVPKYYKQLTKKPDLKILAFPFISHRLIAIIFITTERLNNCQFYFLVFKIKQILSL